MNTAQRLRAIAKRTALDGIGEELMAIAEELEAPSAGSGASYLAIAESVGLIGPRSRVGDTHNAVARFGRALTQALATTEPVQVFLVRDVAALLGASVPDVCKALAQLGHGQRSTNMEITPDEALAVAKLISAPTEPDVPETNFGNTTERKGEPVELPELDDESCAVLEFFNKHLEVIGRGEWYAASTDLTDDTPSYRRATIKDAISMSRYWLPRLTKAGEAMTRFLCAYEGNGADIGARRKAEKLMHAANTSPQVPEDADPLQGAVNWLCEARLDVSVDLIQQKLHIGYNRAKRLFDAARKEPQ